MLAARTVLREQPAVEPVTLEEAKLHCRIEVDDDDDLLEQIIKSAREACESFTGLALISRPVSDFLSEWPSGQRHILGAAPVTEIDALLIDGEESWLPSSETWALRAGSSPAIVRAKSAPWPAATAPADGIEIQYDAGYGEDPSDIPAAIRQGILQLIASLYDNRGDQTGSPLIVPVPISVAALWQPYCRMVLL